MKKRSEKGKAVGARFMSLEGELKQLKLTLENYKCEIRKLKRTERDYNRLLLWYMENMESLKNAGIVPLEEASWG